MKHATITFISCATFLAFVYLIGYFNTETPGSGPRVTEASRQQELALKCIEAGKVWAVSPLTVYKMECR